MFYRKTLSIIFVLFLLSTVFITPNLGKAAGIVVADCWKSKCAPFGASFHIDKEGCKVAKFCGFLFYCEAKICPEEDDDDDDDDTSGNNDDSGSNS